MKRFAPLALAATGLGLFFAAAGAPAARAADKPAKPKPQPEVLVVGDAFGGADANLRPTPGHPIYYLIMGKVERTLGDPVGGEPLPDPAKVEEAIVKTLADQGFIQTKVGGPMPSLALIITWGTANLSMDEIADSDGAGGTTTSTVAYNKREIMQLVGADKANRHLLSSSEADEINSAAREDRLYLFIGALDAQALAKKQKKLVWRTRMSVESRHNTLPESMSVMLLSAAPWLGRDTNMPVFVDDAARRKADVIIGTPTVVPEAAAPTEKKK